MTDYLRTDAAGVAVERISVPDGRALSDVLHPDIAALCHPQGDAHIGDVWDASAEMWAPPPAPAKPPVADITRAQAKIQLRRAGLRDKVEAAVAAAGGEIADWYAEAAVWQRSSPYIAHIGGVLSPPLSAEDIDDLFSQASQIQA